MVISKIDLTKEDPNYYKVGKKPELRDLDPYYYLTIKGKSSPEDPKFQAAVESLYAVAYGIKFLCKAEDNDFDNQLQAERFAQRTAGRQADFKEGVKAFLEKRPANFRQV